MKSYAVENAVPGQTVIAVWQPKSFAYDFYTPEKFQLLEQKLSTLDVTHEVARKLQRLILGTAQEVIVEDDGTVSLPDLDNTSEKQSVTDA